MSEENFYPGALMKRISEVLDKKANSGLAEHGVTFSQMKLLIMLAESGADSVALKELERYFDLTQATIAGLVVRLEKKNLICGFTDPSDKRIKRVRITPEGRLLCETAKSEMIEYENWLLEALSEEEKEEFTRLLKKIYTNIQ